MKVTTLAGAALAVTAALAADGAYAQTTTGWNGAPETREGEQRFKVRGRLQYDMTAVDWNDDAEDQNRSFVRRAFLGAQGRLTERWRYKVDFVLTPSANSIGVDDAFLEYAARDWSIVIGEHNIASPLEDRISSLDTPFVERSSIVTAFEYGRRGGVGFRAGDANWHISAALQGDTLNNADTLSGAASPDESFAVSGRFTFAPVFETAPEGLRLIHLGVHARHRDAGEDGLFRYRARPLNGRGDRHVESAAIGDSDLTLGAELAAQFGPFGVQAEYMTLAGDTAAGGAFDQSGFYVDLYWSLTGESRVYRGAEGAFAAIAPRNPLTVEGGVGHWMLSARYDSIDLSHPLNGAARGEQSAYSLGLDWIPIDHVRFKLNYAASEMDRAAGADADAQIVTLRTQFDF